MPFGAFRSAAARELVPAARGDGPDGHGPERRYSVVGGCCIFYISCAIMVGD